MRRVRLSWIIAALAATALLIAPPLRHQLHAQFAGWRWSPDRRDPVAFVTRSYPHDAQLSLGAGVARQDRGLLTWAIGAGAGPAGWAAYTATFAELIRAPRIGTTGDDPAEVARIREDEKEFGPQWEADRAKLGNQKDVLEALHGWERADPDNGMPFALESIVLYGLDRDAEALRCWRAAGAQPRATAYPRQLQEAVVSLYERMGAPPLEAYTQSLGAQTMALDAQLREGARIAGYEARLAQLQGRPQDAIALWNASADFGQHMQESADTAIDYLVGSAIEGIGAAPTWRWRKDESVGKASASSAPAWTKGRLWFGEQHAFFVVHAGAARDTELRDRRAAHYAQLPLLSRWTEADSKSLQWFWLTDGLGVLSLVLPISAAVVLAFFLLISVARRRQADAAAGSRWWVVPFLALPALSVGAAWCVAATMAEAAAAARGTFYVHLWLPLTTTGAVLIFALLFAAILTSRRTRAWFAVWRGNMRRALPPTIALLLLACIAVTVAGIRPRAEATRHASRNEMASIRAQFGSAWEHPTIPPDAWRAAYPPAAPERAE